MKALSIRQPWAWLIIHGGKDIENRDWYSRHTGETYVHASKKKCTRYEYDSAVDFAKRINPNIAIPPPKDLDFGGIIGTVDIVDCVRRYPSPWAAGGYGFVLRDPQPMAFMPYRGALGFFDVDLDIDV